jgi:hypothetical protein
VKKAACTLEAAQHYLSTVIISHAFGPETTCSVAVDVVVASALIATAEQGKQAKENDGESSCEPIALATLWRCGVQRLAQGSITERLLSVAMVTLLAVRPLAPHAHEPDPRFPLM